MKLLIGLLFSITLATAQAADPHPSARLNWTWAQGTGDAATGFHVQRSATTGGPYTVIGTVPVATLTYLDTTIAVGVPYFYVVTAYNGAGDSIKSTEVTCTSPFQVPVAPTGVSGTAK